MSQAIWDRLADIEYKFKLMDTNLRIKFCKKAAQIQDYCFKIDMPQSKKKVKALLNSLKIQRNLSHQRKTWGFQLKLSY